MALPDLLRFADLTLSGRSLPDLAEDLLQEVVEVTTGYQGSSVDDSLNRVAEYEVVEPGMRVDGLIFSSDELIDQIRRDQAPEQVANVAWLPGIQKASLAMPDIHWGYGFPIGGVAAFDADEGVVSPGGVGYDINCGVRLVRTNLFYQDVKPHLTSLMDRLFADIPARTIAVARDAAFAFVYPHQLAEWRHAGCSMCLAMNADRLEPGERCASTSNRN